MHFEVRRTVSFQGGWRLFCFSTIDWFKTSLVENYSVKQLRPSQIDVFRTDLREKKREVTEDR